MQTTSKIIISVVICTHNRSELLKNCIYSITNQAICADLFEIVIIDNNSSDNTFSVVKDAMSDFSNIKYYFENRTGLSYARNSGFMKATGEYIAYIDDDAQAPPDWIEEILSFIARKDSIVVFGGPYYSFSNVSLPDWLPPEYGVFDAGDKELILNCRDIFLCGTNMIFKKEVLTEVDGFDTDLGMNGKKLCYGEETNLQIKLEKRGYDIYYVPSIKVKHLIDLNKTSLFWHIKSIYAVGRCSSKTVAAKRSLVSHFVGICIGLASALKVSLTMWGIPAKRKFYYAVKRLTAETGALHECLSDKLMNNKCV